MNDGQMSGGPVELLRELDALEAKATPGPWVVGISDHPDTGRDIVAIDAESHGICNMDAPQEDNEPNAEFIAALRNAYPTLRAALKSQSRDEVLEEAARVCEANRQEISCRAEKWAHEVPNAVRDECAEAIRALKSISAEQRDKGHLAGGSNNRDERSQEQTGVEGSK